jgi:hypothetical protein
MNTLHNILLKLMKDKLFRDMPKYALCDIVYYKLQQELINRN